MSHDNHTSPASNSLPESVLNGGRPPAHGLYDPEFEHDSCGVGFIADIKGRATHQILLDADRMLVHMEHRGACGCESNTGDGAGILTALPYEFFKKKAQTDLGIDLPEQGKFATGILFLPKIDSERDQCKQVFERLVAEQGQQFLGWRSVPTDPDAADIGPSARACEPVMEQPFIAAAEGIDSKEFDRQLYIIRKAASRALRLESDLDQRLMFYVCSLSTRLMIYKGMLSAPQVRPYFPDLNDEAFTTHLAMVHSRFATNTFPSWDRAQPLRYMAHNGEINTVRGNSNWMRARQGVMRSELFGDDLRKTFPIAEPECSDSGNFDNCLELLVQAGRPIPEAAMMMIPEAWQNHHAMPEQKRAFYEYYSTKMEPWDGPASVSFTDGKYIGACLDRNGLRPSRYYVTHDDRVVMASEVGVSSVEPENVKFKGRLQPGKMFLVDFEEGRIIPDEELKQRFSSARPYGEWLKSERIELGELAAGPTEPEDDSEALLRKMKAFGYTTETLNFMLVPLIKAKKDPIGSMGDDTALACLSDKPRMLYDYFKQLFAQVTNPAIDSIREEVIMSLECSIGPEGNLLGTEASDCQRLLVPHPILTNEEVASLKAIDHRGWTSKTIDITFPRSEGADGLKATLERIRSEAQQAINDGHSLVILSDRAIDADHVPVPSLLAVGAVHHHLVKHELRTRIGIVLESGEAREVHHFCLLAAYGCDAVNPYIAFESLKQVLKEGGVSKQEWTDEKLVAAYRKGVAKGMLKVFAKMGISTLQSYKGAQIFEALGLGREVIEAAFVGTASRIGGIGLDMVASEAIRRHELGFPSRTEGEDLPILPNLGLFAWRKGGEKHAWNPQTIAAVQAAARTGDKAAYNRFADLVNEETTRNAALRGLMRFKFEVCKSVPLEEVEPASEIVKRFCTGAMSYGSISAEAHESLAIAMNKLGGKSNTGEGGEDYKRFEPMENGESKRSAIKQVASGRFGVTSWYLTNADELQIKISQGAKPGEGGELPGHKVNKIIAATRHSTPGVGLISPPPHHDIYSIEDLAQLIFDLKNSNPSARVSVKLVSEVGVGTIASGVAKGHADNILIAGDSGGTGASPLTSVKHAGLPWELGLAETHQTLVMNDLRSRVRIQTDGQLKTGRDVAIATLLGAEEYGFATAPLITLGCIMMRKCHLNTCPVGIATQDPVLREKFNGQPESVVNYLFMVAEECREIMAKLGFRTINEMVGRCDVLEQDRTIDDPKAQVIDLSAILTPARKPHDAVQVFCDREQDHGLDDVKDVWLIKQAADALEDGDPVEIECEIENIDRAFGTTLSHEISKRWGQDGLAEDTIRIKASGSAGQSVGAWGVRGLTIEVDGDANDYVGKGLCGAKIIIRPPAVSTFVPEENIIIGNVALYGATEGELYARGIAAERFCVRNSGAKAVVEGVGDHACEYMTGGRAVILGPTGRNFAAGMSGGIAYVYDPNDHLLPNCNLEMVDLDPVESDADEAELRELIDDHFRYTDSSVAKAILDDWGGEVAKFVKVMPRDFKRALGELADTAAAATESKEPSAVVATTGGQN
ncbi:glutamate synthase large subunit [Stratiformator vulcanicus]|uniref:Ferredoxin-dependent glutamate synthase 1 n=1 Tax=Stratiformator vulcanicus TaxID=2527980 RepID=A0A517R6K0_9PLAN|nr:glutamate synthase large subunit [Stratiformator vulcanicus]QDT39527.1 Ferredoxin-dependent glutamate synthase 1 [Stratiformator vulcanicus]